MQLDTQSNIRRNVLNHTFQGHFLKEINDKAYSYKGTEKDLKLLLRVVNTGAIKHCPLELGNEKIRLALRVRLRDQSTESESSLVLSDFLQPH